MIAIEKLNKDGIECGVNLISERQLFRLCVVGKNNILLSYFDGDGYSEKSLNTVKSFIIPETEKDYYDIFDRFFNDLFNEGKFCPNKRIRASILNEEKYKDFMNSKVTFTSKDNPKNANKMTVRKMDGYYKIEFYQNDPDNKYYMVRLSVKNDNLILSNALLYDLCLELSQYEPSYELKKDFDFFDKEKWR